MTSTSGRNMYTVFSMHFSIYDNIFNLQDMFRSNIDHLQFESESYNKIKINKLQYISIINLAQLCMGISE